MQPTLLILNAGSSSLKFALFSLVDPPQRLYSGQADFLKSPGTLMVKNAQHLSVCQKALPASSGPHRAALNSLLHWVAEQQLDLQAVGHRVVHGAHFFQTHPPITPEVLSQLESLCPLAPLHQPHPIAAIRALHQAKPELFQVACLDTVFHSTQPACANAYAIPASTGPIPIRRYGFHGLSYEYIAHVAPQHLGQQAAQGRLLVAHLGHGASLCALKNGQSIATTMGFTALDGLPMGTRSGQIDPGVLLYWLSQGITPAAISKILYEQSGLLGVSQISADMRILIQSRDPRAQQAIDLFVYRVIREMGSLMAALEGLDNLIFTAGMGENMPILRSQICQSLARWIPIELDDQANEKNQVRISSSGSPISVWVIPTDEEWMMAQHTFRIWQQEKKKHENKPPQNHSSD